MMNILAKDLQGRRSSKACISEEALKRRRPSVVDGLSIVEVIRKKRDGEELSADEIDWFVSSTTTGLITDAQIGAMLMAVCVRGMTDVETSALTEAMIKSGGRLRYPAAWSGLVVGKHSTGGVGDKVSIVLVPTLAACGLKVPKISGRGLGHTGGTLDKIESIPGCRVHFSMEEIVALVNAAGCCIVGQTEDLVPADKVLYAIRDTTATTESAPLIAASVMCKKAAESLDALCLEVTFGKAALIKTRQQADHLATLMMDIGRRLGIRTTALLVRMDNVLGQAVGNTLEIAEALECLQGRGPGNVIDIVSTCAGYLLWQTNKVKSLQEGKDVVHEALCNGSAYKVFQTMLQMQGVSPALVANLADWLPKAQFTTHLYCPASGYVREIDALACGCVTHRLGSGRHSPDDDIDSTAGLKLLVTVGSQVNEVLCTFTIHCGLGGLGLHLLLAALSLLTTISPRMKQITSLLKRGEKQAMTPESDC